MFEDIILLHFGHSLITGHCPSAISAEQYGKYRLHNMPTNTGKASLGFFDMGSPNLVTFYPDLKPEDLKPKDDDFYYPLVRSLSEVVVHKAYNPVDFSKNDVLKNSMPLLYGQAVYANHECYTGTELGVVLESVWEDGYTLDGIKVPAGINSKLKIDGKSNPRIVRGMTMDPPSVHSFSVSVRFLWEPSHKDIPIEDFYSKLGTFDDKGNMYNRIATKIVAYSELSVVPHGADPWAQIIKDGKLNNPTYASYVNNTESGNLALKMAAFNFVDEINNAHSDFSIPKQINNIYNSNMKEILLLLSSAFGINATGVDDAALAEAIKLQLPTHLTDATASAGIIANLKAEAETAKNKITELTAATELAASKEATEALKFVETHKVAMAAELVSLSAVLNQGTADANIENLSKTANLETLAVLVEQYKSNVDKSIPLTCKKCSSTEISRASVVVPPAGDPGGNKKLSVLEQKAKDKLEANLKNMHE